MAKQTRSSKKPSATPRSRLAPSSSPDKPRLYTLDAFIISGNLSSSFVKKNPVLSRTIQIRGDQTLEDLHYAIFDAFRRWEEHLYEFHFGGKRLMDPKAVRYVMPDSFEFEQHEDRPPAGSVDTTTIDSLGLKVGGRFTYWFDFGDDWWHQINVEAIEDKTPRGKFPKVIKKIGPNPPQYPPEEDEDDEDEEDE